jgi:hypothetical protein
LSELGVKKNKSVEDNGKRARDSEELPRGAKKHKRDDAQISNYFERVTKENNRTVVIEEPDTNSQTLINGTELIVGEGDHPGKTHDKDNALSVGQLGTQTQNNTLVSDMVLNRNDISEARCQNCPEDNGSRKTMKDATTTATQNASSLAIPPPSAPDLSASKAPLRSAANDTTASGSNPPVPDPYADLLEQYTNLGGPPDPPPEAPTPAEPPSTEEQEQETQPTDLDKLIGRCNALIPLQPVRAYTPLPQQSIQQTNSPYDNTQLVADMSVLNSNERFQSSWMHPVQDDYGRRYVSGPPFKRRRVWRDGPNVDYAMMTMLPHSPPDQQTSGQMLYLVTGSLPATGGIQLHPQRQTGGRHFDNLPEEV